MIPEVADLCRISPDNKEYSAMPQYALARHVFVCMQGEHVVFLDVRKDRYFAIESAKTAGLGELVGGWPVPVPRSEPYAVRGDAAVSLVPAKFDCGSLAPVVALLLDKEILTSPEAGKAATPVVVPGPVGEVTGESLDEPTRTSVGSFARFVASSVRARLLLKQRSFESVVARVSNRNRSADPQIRRDDEQVQKLVGIYTTLRPFFFTAKDACLFDALSLHEFLSAYGVYASWVFGVQARPFAAHCWLQLDGLVLNDTVNHVRRYAPIMIV
jgi:hypothetical protein